MLDGAAAPSPSATPATSPVVEPTAPATPPPADTTEATAAPDSLAEHEAAIERDRDKSGRYTKHRSQKQRAGVEDVPRIAELTKNWRTTEERALKAEKELAELREQIKPKPPRPQLRDVPKVETSAFTEQEPKLEDFADQADPYASWNRALAAYDRKKERFDEQQASAKKDAESAQTHNTEQMRQFFAAKSRDFGGRLHALMQREPDSVKLFEAVQQTPLTDVMHAAIMLDPRGEELMLHLAKNFQTLQGELDDLYMLTDGKPVSEGFVALVQRRMHRWTQDAKAPTGSSAPAPVTLAPRPPNPVRTAAMKTADTPPGDEGSLADHEQYFGRK